MTTTQTTTAADVIAAALAYNEGTYSDDERNAIVNGTAGLTVSIHDIRKSNDCRVVVAISVRDTDGYLWLTGQPQVFRSRPTRNFTFDVMRRHFARKVDPTLPLI